jgi:hypothetical protein
LRPATDDGNVAGDEKKRGLLGEASRLSAAHIVGVWTGKAHLAKPIS